MATNGGKRPGAGRPKGSTNVPRFHELVSAKEKEKFKEFILDTYMGDMRLALWMADQLFGKAPQAVELSNPDGSLKTIIIQKTSGNSNDKPTS